MRTVSEPKLLLGGYDSPEGPAFDNEGNLFFVNWLSSSIVKLTPDGITTEFFNTGGIPAGLAFHPDGSLYVADEGDQIHGIMRITPDGESSILANEFEGKPLNGANDLVFDKNGVLYFSDPWTSSADNPIGGFYRLFPDGLLEQIDTGLAFPNGVALTSDESAVVLAETQRDRLLRYEINADGSVGQPSHWADTTTPPGPDGMAFNADGELFVAHFNGGGVDIFGTDGKQIDKIELPGAQATNVAFGGKDGKTLVMTEVSTSSLYTIEVTVPGQKLNDGR